MSGILKKLKKKKSLVGNFKKHMNKKVFFCHQARFHDQSFFYNLENLSVLQLCVFFTYLF